MFKFAILSIRVADPDIIRKVAFDEEGAWFETLRSQERRKKKRISLTQSCKCG